MRAAVYRSVRRPGRSSAARSSASPVTCGNRWCKSPAARPSTWRS